MSRQYELEVCFFQAEDGIRDVAVTGVQTCALPICKEYAQRGEEIVRQVENIANAEITLHTALDAERPNADLSIYVNDANGAAQDHALDIVELVNYDGTVISSAQNPSRVGYKNEWVTAKSDWSDVPAFLKREETPTEVALSLCAVRIQPNVPKPFYIIAGRRLDKNFLASLG